MKKIKFITIALCILAVIGMVLYTHFQRANYNGLCTECGSCTHEAGQVFPYTQYKCHECGNIDLGC